MPATSHAHDTYSICAAFTDTAVLITGATGYVGSLVLEQLLRVGNIKKAYLLMRTKHSQDQEHRLQSLLSSPVFRLHDTSQILPKLSIVAGDLAKPNCGISAADQRKLISEVQYVVHAAASIRFDNNIQTDLQLSYVATKTLADLAIGMKQLRCFMYVSTAYANAHLGAGITAQEQLYPVRDEQGQALDHTALSHRLLSLPAAQAQEEVLALMKRLKAHDVTYGFCKNLTEQLVGSYHMQPYPVCISRPSGVGAVARLPCPGYIGNSAAATGMILSIACGVGTIQGHDPDLAQHQIPGDMTSAIITASMAATAAGQGPFDGPHITHGSSYNSSPLSIKQLIDYTCDYFRDDPCMVYQFGDGKCNIRWTRDVDEYSQWAEEEEQQLQKVIQQLQQQGKAKAAARATTAWKVWRTWSDPRLFGSSQYLDDSNVQKLLQSLDPSEEDLMMLSFDGMSWRHYINLFCAGAKQLYMHELPKHPLQWEPVHQNSPTSRM